MISSKRKNVPKEPRKYRSILLARKFIVQSRINSLPVDPFELCDVHEWALLSWSEARKIMNIDDPLNLKRKKEEARTNIFEDGDTFLIVYDDTLKVPYERIRYTIAHEIGHIVLGHFADFKETVSGSGKLSEIAYQVLEAEADFFASELLAPMPILQNLGVRNAPEIKVLCNISNKASKNREIDLSWWGHKPIAKELAFPLKDLFSSFLEPISLCIKSNIAVPSHFFFKYTNRRLQMTNSHNFIETDAHNRFMTCPQCGNNRISKEAKYCRMCGMYLFNQCEDYTYTDGACGWITSGDARYCENCGEETVLLKKGLLKTWETLIEEYGEVAAGLAPRSNEVSSPQMEFNDPFANVTPIDISDDDLPF